MNYSQRSETILQRAAEHKAQLKKRKKRAIFSTIVSLGLVVVLSFPTAVLVNNISNSGVKMTASVRAQQMERVYTAQYLPDVNKLARSSDEYAVANMSLETNGVKLGKIGYDGFDALVDEMGGLQNYSPSHGGNYSVYDIKNEIYSVLDVIPKFNKWYRLSDLYDQNGDEYWYSKYSCSYFYEYDESDDSLTVTRISWATRFSYLDFENRRSVEYHDDGTQVVQFLLMRAKYYFDEEDREVVECYTVCMAVDHTKRGGYYNPNSADYYPVEMEYLKNVKDKSLTKCRIVYSPRYRSEESFDDGGRDITHITPYGSLSQFIRLDYNGNDDVQLLRVDGITTEHYLRGIPKTFNIFYYDSCGEDTRALFGAFDYSTDPRALLKLYNYYVDAALRDYEMRKLEYERGVLTDEDDVFVDEIDPKLIGAAFVDTDFDHCYYNLPLSDCQSDAVTRSETIILGDDSDSIYTGLYEVINRIAEEVGADKCEPELYYSSDEAANENYGRMAEYFKTLATKFGTENPLIANWQKLYKGSRNYKTIKGNNRVSAAREAIDLSVESSAFRVENEEVYYSISGTVKSTILLERGKEYSLGLVAYSDDDSFVLDVGGAVKYSGSDMTLVAEGSFALNALEIDRSGVYTFGFALVKNTPNGYKVYSGELPAELEGDIEPIVYSKQFDNGYEARYAISVLDGKLVASVNVKDIQPPEISIPSDMFTCAVGTRAFRLLEGVSVTDNDAVASIKLYDPSGSEVKYDSVLTAGEYTIKAVDRSGNSTEVKVTVIII